MKEKLYKVLKETLQAQIIEANEALKGIKEGASPTSSAGDKHNTEQAMLHLEQEKNQKQLSVLINSMKLLSRVNPKQAQSSVGLGSLVKTESSIFYFTIPFGKLSMDGEEVMILSLASPIGQLMKDKKVNDLIEFSGKKYVIKGIE